MNRFALGLMESIDYTEGEFSCFAILIRGTKISIYTYNACKDLLDENNIPHYLGFVPLNYVLDYNTYGVINEDVTIVTKDYLDHVSKYKNIIGKGDRIKILNELKVATTSYIDFPHIFDLLNRDHADHVHNLFKFM